MRLSVIGTGYVGLVAGTCFAESGNDVVCHDIDETKIAALNRGECPIYEPGLEELIERNVRAGRLRFTTDIGEAVRHGELIFVAVGTPQADDGAADLSNLWAVVDAMAPHIDQPKIIVIKSTVPVGTNARVAERLSGLVRVPVDVASNPEFMKEGAAIDDFTRPDRVVVGVRRPAVAEKLRELYAPFLRTDRPFLVMSPESAEMTKYVANAILSTKISFINEMANICERLGADINDVRRGIGHDSRIGFAFLFPGAGYGGSCFPKDVRALSSLARAVGVQPRILEAVDAVNEAQKHVLFNKIWTHFKGRLQGRKFAVWGLSFKPRTDDIREAPSLVLIKQLLDHGARVVAHDPEAMANTRKVLGDRIEYAETPYAALEGAYGLAIVTEWNEFRNPDFRRMRELMAEPVIFDGRNLYDPEKVAHYGFRYYSIGRSPSGPPPRHVGEKSPACTGKARADA